MCGGCLGSSACLGEGAAGVGATSGTVTAASLWGRLSGSATSWWCGRARGLLLAGAMLSRIKLASSSEVCASPCCCCCCAPAAAALTAAGCCGVQACLCCRLCNGCLERLLFGWGSMRVVVVSVVVVVVGTMCSCKKACIGSDVNCCSKLLPLTGSTSAKSLPVCPPFDCSSSGPSLRIGLAAASLWWPSLPAAQPSCCACCATCAGSGVGTPLMPRGRGVAPDARLLPLSCCFSWEWEGVHRGCCSVRLCAGS